MAIIQILCTSLVLQLIRLLQYERAYAVNRFTYYNSRLWIGFASASNRKKEAFRLMLFS